MNIKSGKYKFYSMKLNFYSMNFWLFSDFLTILDLSTIGNVPGFEDRGWYQQPTHTHTHKPHLPTYFVIYNHRTCENHQSKSTVNFVHI